jgi:peptidoglycan/xylan/chitin deacetylase (PgdA/CDA1 family)
MLSAVTTGLTKPAHTETLARPATILVYHAVGPCPRGSDPENLFLPTEVFAWQMSFLARYRVVVTLEAAVAGALPTRRPAVAITFDDAYRSVLTNAAPILRRRRFPATVFVPTGSLGRRAEWHEAPGCQLDVMTAEELVEARDAGLEIESHGARHLDLGRAPAAEVERDLGEASAALERILGRPPRLLAYPYGSTSETAQAVAAAGGYAAAFTVDAPEGGPYARARVGVTGLDGRLAYALKTSGRYMRWRHSPLAYGTYRLVRPLVRRSADRLARG